MSWPGQSELLMEATALKRSQRAMSYEYWTDLDFNNLLKGKSVKGDNVAADDNSQAWHNSFRFGAGFQIVRHSPA